MRGYYALRDVNLFVLLLCTLHILKSSTLDLLWSLVQRSQVIGHMLFSLSPTHTILTGLSFALRTPQQSERWSEGQSGESWVDPNTLDLEDWADPPHAALAYLSASLSSLDSTSSSAACRSTMRRMEVSRSACRVCLTALSSSTCISCEEIRAWHTDVQA